MSSDAKELLVEANGPVATVTINRPDKHNALNRAIWMEIGPTFDALEADESVKVIVIEGAGERAFSAGADISEFAETYATPQSTRAYNDLVRQAQHAIANTGKPVIAMVEGLCVGGGCGLALACDLRFVSDDSQFAITPAKIGAAYSFGDTKQLVDLVGPARAKDILFSGTLIDASRAQLIGLVDHVFPKGELAAETRAYADHLCGLSQNSITIAKQMVNAIRDGADAETSALRAKFDSAFAADDFQEGYRSFLAKRKPNFG